MHGYFFKSSLRIVGILAILFVGISAQASTNKNCDRLVAEPVGFVQLIFDFPGGPGSQAQKYLAYMSELGANQAGEMEFLLIFPRQTGTGPEAVTRVFSAKAIRTGDVLRFEFVNPGDGDVVTLIMSAPQTTTPGEVLAVQMVIKTPAGEKTVPAGSATVGERTELHRDI